MSIQVGTQSRKIVDLHDLKVEDIEIMDIAHSLSMQCRFNGHTDRFYSVAQHSCFVANMIPRDLDDSHHQVSLELTALLHDAPEAYIGDLIRPVKSHCPEFKALEETLHKKIAERFKLQHPIPEIIHQKDLLIMGSEMAQLMGVNGSRWGVPNPMTGETPLITIYPVGPDKAKTMMLEKFSSLMGRRKALLDLGVEMDG